MKIRPLDTKDVVPAMELVLRVFSEFETPEYREEGIAEFKAFIEPDFIIDKMKKGELHLWGACENALIIGVIAVRPPLHISLLFVDKQYHRRGIARKLFDTIMNDKTVVSGHECVTVYSSPYAVEFYRRLGFVQTDTEQVVNGLRFTPMECARKAIRKTNNVLKKETENYVNT